MVVSSANILMKSKNKGALGYIHVDLPVGTCIVFLPVDLPGEMKPRAECPEERAVWSRFPLVPL